MLMECCNKIIDDIKLGNPRLYDKLIQCIELHITFNMNPDALAHNFKIKKSLIETAINAYYGDGVELTMIIKA
jgi:hypothetical protein